MESSMIRAAFMISFETDTIHQEKLMDYGDEIDESTFEQILEMDDDPDDRDFSRGIVVGFIEQADQTFEGMDQAL